MGVRIQEHTSPRHSFVSRSEGDKLQDGKEWGAFGVQFGKLWYQAILKISLILHFEALERGKYSLIWENREKLSLSLAGFGSPPVYPASFIIISSTLQLEHTITYHSELPSQIDSLSLSMLCILSTLQKSARASYPMCYLC